MFQHHAFVEAYLIPLQLVLALLGMGATLGVKDFALVGRNPAGLALGLGVHWLLVPAIAVALAAALGLGPGWAVGLALVAVVPQGALSNLLAFIANGHVALAISITTVTTLACIFTIPLFLQLLASQYLPADFDLPTRRIITDIGLYLLLPLVVGMVLYRLDPARARRFSKWCVGASLVTLVVVTISALGSGRIRVLEHGLLPPATVIAFHVSIIVATSLVCRLLRRPDADAVALSIGANVRNISVALLFVQRFFPDDPKQGHVLYTCLFYGGLSGPLALIATFRHRRGRAPLPFMRAYPPRSPPRVELSDVRRDVDRPGDP